jgi:hypothetical protein
MRVQPLLGGEEFIERVRVCRIQHLGEFTGTPVLTEAAEVPNGSSPS